MSPKRRSSLLRRLLSKKRNRLSEPKSGQELALRPMQQAFVSAVPSLPEGPAGRDALEELFFALFEASGPAVFCDIGANSGEPGLRAKAARPSCTVHGFEANPEIHAMHRQEAEEGGVVWHNTAVGGTAGPVEIFIPRRLSKAYANGYLIEADLVEARNTGKGSLLKRDEDARYDTVEVEGVTLDGFFAEQLADAAAKFMLWIDVEGAASQVLAGAGRVLDRTEALLIEVEGHLFWQGQAGVIRVFRTLLEQGFQPLARDREYGDAQFNVVFVREALLTDPNMEAVSDYLGAGGRSVDALAAVTARSGATSRGARTVEEARRRDTPVLVPCFNNPSHCAGMLNQLQRLGMRNITFVDNASTSPEMAAWLEAAEKMVKVIRLDENPGPRLSIFTERNLAVLPRYFCVTDPDLVLNPALPRDFLAELVMLTHKYEVGKVGMALDISRRHAFHQGKFEIGGERYRIWEWEEQFWTKPLGETSGGDRVFEASVDTTFALYDQKYFESEDFLTAVRVAGRYTAQHLPWYAESSVPVAEAAFYARHQKHSYYAPRLGRSPTET